MSDYRPFWNFPEMVYIEHSNETDLKICIGNTKPNNTRHLYYELKDMYGEKNVYTINNYIVIDSMYKAKVLKFLKRNNIYKSDIQISKLSKQMNNMNAKLSITNNKLDAAIKLTKTNKKKCDEISNQVININAKLRRSKRIEEKEERIKKQKKSKNLEVIVKICKNNNYKLITSDLCTHIRPNDYLKFTKGGVFKKKHLSKSSKYLDPIKCKTAPIDLHEKMYHVFEHLKFFTKT